MDTNILALISSFIITSIVDGLPLASLNTIYQNQALGKWDISFCLIFLMCMKLEEL